MYAAVFFVALAAGALSGIVGTGSSLILLPLLVQTFGPKAAIPIMAIAAIIGNFSRAAIWWRSINWRATLAYSVLGVPASALGAHTLLALPAWIIDICLGIFFWLMIPLGRFLKNNKKEISTSQLCLSGGVIGFLTGLVLSTGPLSVPSFTAYGLSGGAFLGTEAVSALFLYLTKASTFAAQGALSPQVASQGILVGGGIMLGTFISKPLVLNLTPEFYALLINLTLLISGAVLIGNCFIN